MNLLNGVMNMNNINHIIYVKYWQECNNRCSFCNQRLGTKVNDFGTFIEPSKKSLIVHTDLLLKEYYKNPAQDVNVFLMGGELFHRQDIKELYTGFSYLANRISEIKHESFKIRFFSSLLYNDVSLLLFFINRLKELNISSEIAQLKTSFDLDGRFKNDTSVDLFVRNLKIIKKTNIPIQIKSTLTLDTLKNFNKNSYVFKTFNEIKHIPNTWCLERFKDEHVDSADLIKRFRIEKVLTILENLSPALHDNLISIEKEFSSTNSQLLISYQHHTVNNIKFIIAGKTKPIVRKYEENI